MATDQLAAALADGTTRVVDLTQPLSETTPVLQLPPPFANTPGLSRETISEYDDAGPAWAWKTLTVGEHVGTHFDAPIHWITGRDGEDVASAPRVQARRALRGDRQVRRGGRRPELPADARGHPGVGERARRAARRAAGCSCARAGTPAPTTRPRSSTAARRPARTSTPPATSPRRAPIVGFGCETVGTDAGLAHAFDPAFPVHHLLLGAGKYGLTQLANLAELPPTGAIAIVAPLKLVDGTGSPSRVFALI